MRSISSFNWENIWKAIISSSTSGCMDSRLFTRNREKKKMWNFATRGYSLSSSTNVNQWTRKQQSSLVNDAINLTIYDSTHFTFIFLLSLPLSSRFLASSSVFVNTIATDRSYLGNVICSAYISMRSTDAHCSLDKRKKERHADTSLTKTDLPLTRSQSKASTEEKSTKQIKSNHFPNSIHNIEVNSFVGPKLIVFSKL